MSAKKERRGGVREAKTHLSRLLREVEEGVDIVVVRGAHPIARIIRATDVRSPSESYGMFAGQFETGDYFDADSDELADLFGIPR